MAFELAAADAQTARNAQLFGGHRLGGPSNSQSGGAMRQMVNIGQIGGGGESVFPKQFSKKTNFWFHSAQEKI